MNSFFEGMKLIDLMPDPLRLLPEKWKTSVRPGLIKPQLFRCCGQEIWLLEKGCKMSDGKSLRTLLSKSGALTVAIEYDAKVAGEVRVRVPSLHD